MSNLRRKFDLVVQAPVISLADMMDEKIPFRKKMESKMDILIIKKMQLGTNKMIQRD